MITKEQLHDFINHYFEFESAIERLEIALCGKKYGCNLYETDWCIAVGQMLDLFLETHFTTEGVDWITYFMFEDLPDKVVHIKLEKDMLNEELDIEYHLNTFDELWNFLQTNVTKYFKNV